MEKLYEQSRLFTSILLIIIIVAGWFWWSHIYEGSQSVFWGMLNNSLATSAVTRQVTEKAGGQNLNETIVLELGKNNIARANTVLSQGMSVVSTETIGTPLTDYTRYTAAKTATKTTSGKSLNFSKIIGIWSKSTTVGISTDPLDHLFGQTLLGVVPIGNLPPQERINLLNQMKTSNVFSVNYSDVLHGYIKGRSVYIYKVSVAPVAYAQLLTVFARDEGYNNVPELSTSNYRGDQPLQVQFAINPASRQLIEITYPGSNHVELYGDYGVQPIINIPTHTISTAALEQRLLTIE